MRNFSREKALQKKGYLSLVNNSQITYYIYIYIYNYPDASTLNFLKAVCRLSSSPSLASDFIVKLFTLL